MEQLTKSHAHNPRSLATWGALFVGALAIRWLYLQEISTLPDFDVPAVDAAYHDYWAWSLVSGEWLAPGGQIASESPQIEGHAFFRPPGYPHALAAIYAVFGHSFLAARWVQFTLGALSCLLAAELGRSVAGLRAGFFAGLIVATHWVVIYFEGELQPPVIATPLILAAFLACLRGGRMGAVVAGAAVGLAGLVVPNALILAPVLAAWFLWKAERPGAGLVVAAALLALVPSTARNYSVAGEFVPISTNFGINLFAGNNPDATGHDVDVAGFGTSFDHLRMVELAAKEADAPLTHVQASRHWATKGLSHVAAHPVRAAVLTLKKGWMFWADREIFSNKELNTSRSESEILAWSPWRWSILLGLAVMGLVASGKKRPAALLLFGAAVAFSATYLPFFVTARYRVPLIPVLAVLAAVGIEEVLTASRDRLVLPLFAGAAALGLAQIDLAEPINPAHWHYMLGVSHARQGEREPALERFARSLRADPEHWSTLYERARLYGHTDQALALEDLRVAHAGAPESPAIAVEYGLTLRRDGKLEQAISVYRTGLERHPDHALLNHNLAVVLRSIDDLEGALVHARHAVEANPDFGQGWVNLGNYSGQAQRYNDAAAAFKEATRLGAQGGRQNWAQALSWGGKHDEALAIYNAWVNDEGRDPQALMQLAQALQRADRDDEALDIFAEAHKAAPEDPAIRAYRLLALLEAADADTALEVVVAGLRTTPKDPYLSLQHAMLLASHPDAARRDGAAALAQVETLLPILGAQRAEVHETHACALAELGRFAEAAGAIDRALVLAGTDDELVARLTTLRLEQLAGHSCRMKAP